MKKWVSILLAALMLLGMTALAESTSEGADAVTDETTFVPFTLVHYNPELNYMISYTAGEFFYSPRHGHDNFTTADEESVTVLVTSTDVRMGSVDALLNEAVGGYGPDAVISEPTEKMLEGELTGHSGVKVDSIEAQLDGVTTRFYLVYKPAADADARIDVLCITATFRTAEAELYSDKLNELVDSIVLNVPEAQYQGEGWQLWYPSEIVKPQEIYGQEGFVAADEAKSDVSMIVVQSDVAPEQVPDLLDEAMGGYAGYYGATDQVEEVMENGMVVRWFEVEQDGTTDRYYAVWAQDGDGTVYCITASFPGVTERLYGAAFDGMVRSFVLDGMIAD